MDFICSKMQNIKESDQGFQERHKATDIRSLNFACDMSVKRVTAICNFASLVPLPRNSIIARRRQFFINKSEKFRAGVK